MILKNIIYHLSKRDLIFYFSKLKTFKFKNPYKKRKNYGCDYHLICIITNKAIFLSIAKVFKNIKFII